MKRLFSLILGLLTLLYPVAVYFGLNYFEPRYLILVLALLFGLRTLVASEETLNQKHALILFAGISIFSSLVFFANSKSLLLYYPVLVSLLFLFLLSFSLLFPPTMIERFARIKDPELSVTAINYTKAATVAWCLFFVFNGSIAFYTAQLGNLKIWSLYNGLISYCLIGLFFSAEFTFRHFYRKKHHDF
jgi:uncharacterized membrane protein